MSFHKGSNICVCPWTMSQEWELLLLLVFLFLDVWKLKLRGNISRFILRSHYLTKIPKFPNSNS